MPIFNNDFPLDHYLLSSSISKVKEKSQNLIILFSSSEQLSSVESQFLNENSNSGYNMLHLIFNPNKVYTEGTTSGILADLGAQLLHIYSDTISNPPSTPFFVNIATSGRIESISPLNASNNILSSVPESTQPLIPSFESEITTDSSLPHPLRPPPLYSSLGTESNVLDLDSEREHDFHDDEHTPLRPLGDRISSFPPRIIADPTGDELDSIDDEFSEVLLDSNAPLSDDVNTPEIEELPTWKRIRNYMCCGCGFCKLLSPFHWIPSSFWEYPPDVDLWLHILEHHSFEDAPEPLNAELFGLPGVNGQGPPGSGSGQPDSNRRGRGRRTGMVTFSTMNDR